MNIKINLRAATKGQLEILLNNSFDLIHEATNRGDRVAANSWARVSGAIKDRLVELKYARTA